MMRPYPRSKHLNRQKKVFNYRLSRARRVIESAFGILAAKWRIYRRAIIASVSTAEKIIQATVCLHNFIILNENKLSNHYRRYTHVTTEDQIVNGALQENTRPFVLRNKDNSAYQIRNYFATYFENAGALPWQWEKVLQNDF
ncbi:hypothetical protein PUN28_016968 [Cardiocondyla obscurior]|uniref:DDE Tnp4 domain-containing protein n=2 Tax=Cardiocondyla obscurior TaxID=286306 RepID=A0AAW2ENJ5_9HYME